MKPGSVHASRRGDRRRSLGEPPAYILPALAVLLFFPVLFLGETLFYRDLFAYFLPQKWLGADMLAAGQLPLWDPYRHGGQAYLTNVSNFAFYPLNLIYLLLPPLRAFNATIALHAGLSSLATYVLARQAGMAPASGFVAGAVYAYSGYSLAAVNLLNLQLAMPYVPLALLCWDRHLRGAGRGWFALAIGAAVAPLILGAPEVGAILLLLLLGWGLAGRSPDQTRARLALRWLALAGLTLLAAAFVVLPALEISAASARGRGLSPEMVGAWSIDPKRLPELLLPEFFGSHVRSLDPAAYWGSGLMRERAPTFPSIHLGSLTLLLALAGGLRGDGDGRLRPGVRRFLLVAAAAFAIASLGRFLPFFGEILSLVPPLTAFRFPSKLLLGALLPVALLAGRGCGSLLSPAATAGCAPRGWRVAAFAGAAILGLAAAGFAVPVAAAVHFVADYFHGGPNAHAVSGLARSTLHAGLCWLALALLLHLGRASRPWHAPALAALVAVDLVAAGSRVNPSAPEELFLEPPPVVARVRDELGSGRLQRDPGPGRPQLRAPSDDLVWYYRYRLETLDADLGSYYRLPVVFHEDLVQLAPARLVQLTSLLGSLPWDRRWPLLAAGAVTLVLSPRGPAEVGRAPLAEVPHRGDHPLYLYRNPIEARRAWVVHEWSVAATGDDSLHAMAAGLDPRVRAVVQDGPWASSPECGGTAEVDEERWTPGSMRVRVVNPCDGYLVFAEPFYPGWSVTVDGRPARQVPANHAFTAVRLPAGVHRVARRYAPRSLWLGLAISAATVAGIGIALRRPIARGRRARGRAAAP